MATMLVSVTVDPARADRVLGLLRGEMAPWMRRQPGFVASHWSLDDDRTRCTIVVEFDAEEHARAVAEATLALPTHPARSWNVERVEVAADPDLSR
ncbi:antibiotic biosynthesis monooxygenase [Nocardioides sp. TF02-7]|uniref:antibiotic biosynthesis monooxygenase n=1 Tax=Nocardioides sp. TF02-7 TaxID=2917724 RepID=UPI001F070DEF|nr:antibiotic biosynthesis monooxygenase [Nocardioides sp. TF02-7]UMG93123.1 antibiotic biosynthesis monooxygenase [Nocardioides sp. TF02-7]